MSLLVASCGNLSVQSDKILLFVLLLVVTCHSFCLWTNFYFFFLSGFSFMDTDNLQDSRGREGTFFLFLFTTSTRSRTFRHLCATLCYHWLPLHSILFQKLCFTCKKVQVISVFSCGEILVMFFLKKEKTYPFKQSS